MKRILTIINLVFFMFTIAPIVNSQTIDQTHTGTNNWYTCLSTTQILGQSFTAEISGALTKISIDFALSCSDATEYPITIEIVQGSFHANPLASESIVVNLPYDRNMLEVNFSNPANVTAGDEYMIRLTPDYVTCEDDPFDGPMEACGLWYISNGDGYPNGIPLIISGGTASSDGNNDRYFTTTVTEASPGIILNGAVSAESNQIKNVADPTEAQDATTKNYVDSNINSFSGSYNDLTEKPITYTQSQVDALIEGIQNQINSLQRQAGTEIDFETYFDLETGDVCNNPFSCDSRFDLKFPYGGGDIKARLWWNESDVDVAYVYDMSFLEIQLSDVSSYYFCEHINDPNQACSDTDSPPTNFIGIYHTSEGNYYAVEYLNENTGSNKVSFRYKLLQ